MQHMFQSHRSFQFQDWAKNHDEYRRFKNRRKNTLWRKTDQNDKIRSSINFRPILRFALDNRFTDSFIQSLIGPKILQVNTYWYLAWKSIWFLYSWNEEFSEPKWSILIVGGHRWPLPKNTLIANDVCNQLWFRFIFDLNYFQVWLSFL